MVLPAGTRIGYVIDAENRRVGRKVEGALVQGWQWKGRPPRGEPETHACRHRFGMPHSGTDYRIALPDFLLLIQDPSIRHQFRHMITAWYGVRFEDDEGGTRIVEDGAPLDPALLHIRIRSHPEKQWHLYQAAMTLWR